MHFFNKPIPSAVSAAAQRWGAGRKPWIAFFPASAPSYNTPHGRSKRASGAHPEDEFNTEVGIHVKISSKGSSRRVSRGELRVSPSHPLELNQPFPTTFRRRSLAGVVWGCYGSCFRQIMSNDGRFTYAQGSHKLKDGI